jgi:hypothetical protein
MKLAYNRVLLLIFGAALSAFAANAPDSLANMVYHESERPSFNFRDEDIALQADGTALGYLLFSGSIREGFYRTPAGDGTFVYRKTGDDTATLTLRFATGTIWNRTLVFTSPTAGSWTDGPIGPATSQTFSLRSLRPGYPVLNSSSRSTIAPNSGSIFGFVIEGNRQVLVRVVGPGLQQFGVQRVASAPQLDVFSGSGARIATNTSWEFPTTAYASPPLGPIFRLVGAFPLASGSKDAALMLSLGTGAYTLHATTSSDTGEVLTEVYVLP